MFDIFINDLYGKPGDIRELFGVTVPGVDIQEEGLLAGLLFADDLVGFAESVERMKEHAKLVDEWCRRWDMRVGIKKCGVMCLGYGETAQKLADEGQSFVKAKGRQTLALAGSSIKSGLALYTNQPPGVLYINMSDWLDLASMAA